MRKSGEGYDRGAARFPPTEVALGAAQLPREHDSIAFDATIARSEIDETETLDASHARLGISMPDASELPPISVSIAGADRTLSPSADAKEGSRASETVELEVVGLLGEGGMGVVHLAEQRSLRRRVAIKTTRDDAPPSAKHALCEEAVVTGKLEHPGIIPVHAFGRAADGRPVMVMKRVIGVSWKELLEDGDHPMWEKLDSGDRLGVHLSILKQLCNALSLAHSEGIVHRDIKPENVMLGEYGEVYLVDWGLASRERQGPSDRRIVGTPAYMAPEMVAGWPVDARTDVYLLGATLHHVLTGAAPHQGESLPLVLARAYESPILDYDPSVPDELIEVCRLAMARDPDRRLRTVAELRARIADFLQHRGSIALSRRAEERLRGAESKSMDDEEERRALRRLLTEAHFGFRQALDEWSENVAARRGLERCIIRSTRLEIAEGHAQAARVSMEALSSPPVELRSELERLEERLEHERLEAERIRALARDMDTRVGQAARRKGALVIALIGVLVSIFAIRRMRQGEFEPQDLVRIAVFMFMATCVLVFFLRKRLFANAFNAKVAVLTVCASGVMVVHRMLAVLAAQEVPTILAMDSLLFTAMLIVAAVALARFMFIGALATGIGAALAIARPEHAPIVFSTSTLSMLILAIAFWKPSEDRE